VGAFREDLIVMAWNKVGTRREEKRGF